ncbi:energy-coupling factor transporter transmembrane component T family protein [Corynebacterium argentoratense]|uniref:energy-coupling factor transporter transmembrane component T family protein n=1 Tax=Corynebacterium argentoratense TaxID=42817 RepID=UPI001F36EAC8|nr:energy-coupling factor transporter transmembrane component T [Corynebacterium argentoratense]MCF1765264.1 energy-coupling factor transporter transmembrane protein EcfT [Corynebacterium argentoratense]
MNVLEKVNPVVRLIAVMLLTTPLLFSVDVVSAAVCLAFVVALAPLCGVGLVQLAKTAWPVFAVLPVAGLSMALYGKRGGHEYFSFFYAHVTDNSLMLAAAIMVRMLAVSLPVIIVARTLDSTRLGDGLAQVLHFPARFVIGAVSAVRMVGLFRRDWQALGRARRSRGLANDGRIFRAFTMVFALLVLALRRADKLATAMDARGFGAPGKRTWARPSTVGMPDVAAVCVAIAVAAISIAVAVVTGSYDFLNLGSSSA